MKIINRLKSCSKRENFILGLLTGILLLTIISSEIFNPFINSFKHHQWFDHYFEIIRIILTIAGFGYAYWLLIRREKGWDNRDEKTRQKQVNDWFHETYILKGIDPLIAYLNILIMRDEPKEYLIVSMGETVTPENFKFLSEPDFPMQSLVRIQTIMGDDTASRLILELRDDYYHCRGRLESALLRAVGITPDFIVKKIIERLKKTVEKLEKLSRLLLDIEIDSKSDIWSLSKENTDIAFINGGFNLILKNKSYKKSPKE